eukprot:1891019-Prymnesium_polylepis.1
MKPQPRTAPAPGHPGGSPRCTPRPAGRHRPGRHADPDVASVCPPATIAGTREARKEARSCQDGV